MIRTKQKVLPLILRLVSILFGLIFVTLVILFTKEYWEDFSEPHFIGILTLVSLGLLQIGTSIFSIKTYSIDENKISVNILWGLISRKIEFQEIENIKSERAAISFGKVDEQIILNLKNRSTVFINELDQEGFIEFRKEIEKHVESDNSISPNYWTIYIKVVLTVLVFWMLVMLFLLIF
jgi:hypothetical protein